MPKTGWNERRRALAEARRKRPLARRLLRDWLLPIAVIAAIMAPIRASIVDWNDVPSGSMRPTILEGDRIFVNKLAYGLRVPLTTSWLARWGVPARGDIVVFASPTGGARLVKRVVGLPGDRVRLAGNVLYINDVAAGAEPGAHAVRLAGSPVPVVLAHETIGDVEHQIALTPALAALGADFAEVTVPGDACFVLGDNRDQSSDSRFIGFVPLASVYGQATHVALSLDYSRLGRPRWERFFAAMR